MNSHSCWALKSNGAAAAIPQPCISTKAKLPTGCSPSVTACGRDIKTAHSCETQDSLHRRLGVRDAPRELLRPHKGQQGLGLSTSQVRKVDVRLNGLEEDSLLQHSKQHQEYWHSVASFPVPSPTRTMQWARVDATHEVGCMSAEEPGLKGLGLFEK